MLELFAPIVLLAVMATFGWAVGSTLVWLVQPVLKPQVRSPPRVELALRWLPIVFGALPILGLLAFFAIVILRRHLS